MIIIQTNRIFVVPESTILVDIPIPPKIQSKKEQINYTKKELVAIVQYYCLLKGIDLTYNDLNKFTIAELTKLVILYRDDAFPKA